MLLYQSRRHDDPKIKLLAYIVCLDILTFCERRDKRFFIF